MNGLTFITNSEIDNNNTCATHQQQQVVTLEFLFLGHVEWAPIEDSHNCERYLSVGNWTSINNKSVFCDFKNRKSSSSSKIASSWNGRGWRRETGGGDLKLKTRKTWYCHHCPPPSSLSLSSFPQEASSPLICPFDLIIIYITIANAVVFVVPEPLPPPPIFSGGGPVVVVPLLWQALPIAK